METETITVAQAGRTLSEILARHYRARFPGMAGKTYALNQDLARAGVFVPVGTVLTVPTRRALEAQAAAQDVPELW